MHGRRVLLMTRVAGSVVVLLAGLVACGRATKTDPLIAQQSGKPASVEGDAYLVTKSGGMKPGAGQTIYLVPDTDSLQAAVRDVCERLKTEEMRWAARLVSAQDSAKRIDDSLPDSRLLYLTEQEALLRRQADGMNRGVKDSINVVLLRHTMDSTRTGTAAHYRFANVPPGRYMLFGSFDTGDHSYRWAAPITLAPGDSAKRDLDNSAEASARLYCGIGP